MAPHETPASPASRLPRPGSDSGDSSKSDDLAPDVKGHAARKAVAKGDSLLKLDHRAPSLSIADDELLEGEVIDLPNGSYRAVHDGRKHGRGSRHDPVPSGRRRSSGGSRSTVLHLTHREAVQEPRSPSFADFASQSPATPTSPFLGFHGSATLNDKRPSSPRSNTYSFEEHSTASAIDIPPRKPRRSVKRSSSASSAASSFLGAYNSSVGTSSSIANGFESTSFASETGDRYVVGRQIGFGGFGSVHEGVRDLPGASHEVCAIKIIRRAMSTQQESVEHEIKIWRSLLHGNIVALDAISYGDEATFCVMQRASCSLYSLARQHRIQRGLPLDLTKHYLRQLAGALRYLHRDMGIVHRDVKLENCLVYYDQADLSVAVQDQQPSGPLPFGTLRLGDFGLALPAEQSSSMDPLLEKALQPQTVHVAGSLTYLAPELLRDEVEHGAQQAFAVDSWAFGVVAYTLLTGRPPFSHDIQGVLVQQITSGNFNSDLLQAVVKAKAPAEQAMFEIVYARDLISGLLDGHVGTRWRAGQVLSCQFLQ